MKSFFAVMCFVLPLLVNAATEDTSKDTKVRYKAGKELNFEQLVIEGQLKRPELSVVTGDNDETGNGLLRLRENFLDRMAEAAGEEAQ